MILAWKCFAAFFLLFCNVRKMVLKSEQKFCRGNGINLAVYPRRYESIRVLIISLWMFVQFRMLIKSPVLLPVAHNSFNQLVICNASIPQRCSYSQSSRCIAFRRRSKLAEEVRLPVPLLSHEIYLTYSAQPRHLDYFRVRDESRSFS